MLLHTSELGKGGKYYFMRKQTKPHCTLGDQKHKGTRRNEDGHDSSLFKRPWSAVTPRGEDSRGTSKQRLECGLKHRTDRHRVYRESAPTKMESVAACTRPPCQNQMRETSSPNEGRQSNSHRVGYNIPSRTQSIIWGISSEGNTRGR